MDNKISRSDLIADFRTKEILGAAADLVRREGMERLTMERVAAEAGVAKGTVYIYFKDKEELITSLMRQTMSEMVDAITSATKSGESIRERLTKITEVMRQVGEENFEFLIHVHRTDLVNKRFCERDSKAPAKQRLFDFVESVFREARDRGEIIDADTEVLSLLFLQSMHALFHWCLEEQRDPEGKLELLIDLILHGIHKGKGYSDA